MVKLRLNCGNLKSGSGHEQVTNLIVTWRHQSKNSQRTPDFLLNGKNRFYPLLLLLALLIAPDTAQTTNYVEGLEEKQQPQNV